MNIRLSRGGHNLIVFLITLLMISLFGFLVITAFSPSFERSVLAIFGGWIIGLIAGGLLRIYD